MLALKKNASYLSIAREIGVSNKTIKRFMMKHGITMAHPRNHSASVRAMEQALTHQAAFRGLTLTHQAAFRFSRL